MNIIKLKGRYIVKLLDRNHKVIREAIIPNGITDIGKDTLLDIMFHAVSQVPTWYIGLIDSSGFSALSDNDTMASHSGWTEYQNYAPANRVEWQEDSASDQSIINPTTAYAEFTIVGNPTLKGLFLASDNIKGGVAGVLWSTALFQNSNVGGDWSVSDGQTILIQYGVGVEG